jgi:hypothetical protein
VAAFVRTRLIFASLARIVPLAERSLDRASPVERPTSGAPAPVSRVLTNAATSSEESPLGHSVRPKALRKPDGSGCPRLRTAASVIRAFGFVSDFGFRISSFRPAAAALLATLGLAAFTASAAPVHLRVNQVGYAPSASKLAVAFSVEPLPDWFEVLEAGTDRRRLSKSTRPLRGMTWGRFTHFAELDFTRLRAPGRYRLRLGEGRSLPFDVQAAPLVALPDALLEFLRQQRCGYNPWLDAGCHSHDGRTAYGPWPAGTWLDARGGWHDAGDLLKYLLTSGNATAQLLLAWQLASHAPGTVAPRPHRVRFADRVDASGRPGPNGLADVLDEARWGLEWLLKLHPAPDHLYHQVADDRDHYGWRLPQNEAADYGWGKGSNRVVYFADGHPQGLGKLPERIHRRGQPGGPLRRGHGFGLPDLEGRPLARGVGAPVP